MYQLIIIRLLNQRSHSNSKVVKRIIAALTHLYKLLSQAFVLRLRSILQFIICDEQCSSQNF